jgi:hypothetical protein
MTRKDYDILPMTAPIGSGQMSKTNLHLVPRWSLYGGPIPTRAQASDWETYLQFWAQSQGLVWVNFPDSNPCIVANHRIPWPPNSAFAWTWVREATQPRRVVYSKTYGKYLWE